MALDKFDKPFKSKKVKELFDVKKEDEDDQEKKNDKKSKKDNKPKKEKPSVNIYSSDIMDRLTVISPNFGQQVGPAVIQKEKKSHILYLSNHNEGKSQLWQTTIEPFKKNKIEQISDKNVRNYQLVS